MDSEPARVADRPDITVPEGDIRAALQRLLASVVLARAPRLQRFLAHVVEAALQGRAAELKEYTLGVEVFDRGSDFDPRADPIVRVDARRLRKQLAAYYAGEGGRDPLEIVLEAGSYAPRFRRRAVAPADVPAPIRLAVLPFVDRSVSAEDVPIAVGLTDELMLALGREPALQVIGRASAFALAEGERDLVAIGRRLEAAMVLEGTMRRDGDAVHVTALLSRTGDGTQVWSGRFTEAAATPQHLQAIEQKIAERIVAHLVPGLQETAPRPARATASTDATAYALYLRGRHAVRRYEPQALAGAVTALQAALARDPGFAAAWAALAEAQVARAVFLLDPPAVCLAEARRAGLRAIAADAALPNAHAALGVVHALGDYDHHAAGDSFARALALAPHAPDVRHQRAIWHLAPTGRLEEAAAELDHLLASDPFNLRLRYAQAHMLLCRRSYEQVIEQLGLLLDLEPRFGPAHFLLAFAHERVGQPELARAAHEAHVRALDYPLTALWLEAMRADWDGDAERARRTARRMERQGANGLAGSTVMADLYMRLGDADRAFPWLERAIEERMYRVLYLAVDPAFDPVRADPRFPPLLRRIGLV